MNITITRKSRNAEALDGILSIDGFKLCDTAEHCATALAEGTYRIVRHKCKQYGRKMLRLEAATLSNPVRSAGVTKQESEFWLEASTRCDHCPKLEFVCNNTTMPIYCPMLKPGNGIYNRADGSIIVGTYIAPGCLKNSKEPFESLCERIRKLSSRGSEISLTIKNRY